MNDYVFHETGAELKSIFICYKIEMKKEKEKQHIISRCLNGLLTLTKKETIFVASINIVVQEKKKEKKEKKLFLFHLALTKAKIEQELAFPVKWP